MAGGVVSLPSWCAATPAPWTGVLLLMPIAPERLPEMWIIAGTLGGASIGTNASAGLGGLSGVLPPPLLPQAARKANASRYFMPRMLALTDGVKASHRHDSA